MFKRTYEKQVNKLKRAFDHKWVLVLIAVISVVAIGWMATHVNSFLGENTKLSNNTSNEGSSIQFQVESVKRNESGENYFVNYRLDRAQSRQESKAMLGELLNSTVVKTKEEAQKKWLELDTQIQKESAVENILKIKGFQDTVVAVLPENVTVIVYSSSLTPNEISKIQDIVVRVTNVRLDKILISTKQ